MTETSFVVPETLAQWQTQRKQVAATLRGLLGDLPPRPAGPPATVVSREERAGYALERFVLDNGAGDSIPGYLLIPHAGRPPFPAIQYLHAHGGRYSRGKEEIFSERVEGVHNPGEVLAHRGYVVMATDAYAFGEREGCGPGGPEETGRAGEESLFKLMLWRGQSLWGMMVRDDQIALDYLCTRSEVDTDRIGATGMSMGSTRAWWLAALDARIAAVVAVACLTRYTELIAHQALSQHSIYYFVPGMLQHFDTEAVTSLIAPRPLLTLIGDQDAGSPVSGADSIAAITARIYALYGQAAQFRHVVYPGVGHVYTPAMWEAMLGWMDAALHPAAEPGKPDD